MGNCLMSHWQIASGKTNYSTKSLETRVQKVQRKLYESLLSSRAQVQVQVVQVHTGTDPGEVVRKAWSQRPPADLQNINFRWKLDALSCCTSHFNLEYLAEKLMEISGLEKVGPLSNSSGASFTGSNCSRLENKLYIFAPPAVSKIMQLCKFCTHP